MGLVAVLFAMARALGADLPDQPPREIVRAKLSGRPQQLTYPIEVQYMLRVGDERIGDVRRELGDIGDSVTVIGGAGEWRVHVHTDVQDEAIAIGRRAGDVDGIEIVDLAEQIAARRGWRGIEMARADDAARLIAVADGEGARALFRELGAVAVAPAELPSAIEAGSGKPFIVLANGKEAARAARASANGSGIEVIEARDAAHGLAAAVAYADGRSAAETIADMRGALLSTRSGAADDARSLVSVARDLGGASADALTVLASADVAGAEREAVGAELRRTFPRAEVEVHDGGQSSPRFVVSVEGVSE
jgi:dihydroxyacetone kinase-like predicted kinase